MLKIIPVRGKDIGYRITVSQNAGAVVCFHVKQGGSFPSRFSSFARIPQRYLVPAVPPEFKEALSLAAPALSPRKFAAESVTGKRPGGKPCFEPEKTIFPNKQIGNRFSDRRYIIIHPQSGWYYNFGHSPNRYRRRTSALMIDLPVTHLLLAARKRGFSALSFLLLCPAPLSWLLFFLFSFLFYPCFSCSFLCIGFRLFSTTPLARAFLTQKNNLPGQVVFRQFRYSGLVSRVRS